MVQESSENSALQASQANPYGYSYQYDTASQSQQPQQPQQYNPQHQQQTPQQQNKIEKYRFMFGISQILSAILFSICISFTNSNLWKLVGFKSLNSYYIFMMVITWPIAFVYIVLFFLALLQKLFHRGVDVPTVPSTVSNIIYMVFTVLLPLFSLTYFVVACTTTRTWALNNFSYFMFWAILAFQNLLLSCFLLIKANLSLILTAIRTQSIFIQSEPDNSIDVAE